MEGLKVIFAPWRIRYVRMPKRAGCIFCELPKENRDEENLILYRGKKVFAIMNNFPYNPGHVMVAPYRHVPSIEDLEEEEELEMIELAKALVKAIRRAMNPDGFDIGINLGRVAGAGIEDHVHMHIVPRWNGDTNFMPVLADVRVIPQALQESYREIKEKLEEVLREK